MLRFLRKRHSGLASSNGETKHLMPRVFKGCNTRYFLFNFSYGDKVPRSFLGRLFAIAWTLFGLVLMTFLLADITNALISYSMQRSVNKKVYGAKVLFNYDNTKKRVLKKKSCFAAVTYFFVNLNCLLTTKLMLFILFVNVFFIDWRHTVNSRIQIRNS